MAFLQQNGSYAFSFEKKYICWEAGARRSDTRLDQKGRKFAKNAIGYTFFNAHFRLFLKTSLSNSLRTSACQHMYSKEKEYASTKAVNNSYCFR
ncbi:hypothetical protein HYV57_03260 [Candidatus Peregrinibacteria bacterium]|nr:hypothetical protein [Candidatus Peregrinibacteria bacterium]